MTIRIQVTFDLYPSFVHETLFLSKVEQLDMIPAVPRPQLALHFAFPQSLKPATTSPPVLFQQQTALNQNETPPDFPINPSAILLNIL